MNRMEGSPQIRHKEASYRESIPTVEVIIYFAIWIGSTSYSCVAVYFASSEHEDTLYQDYFTPGWLPGLHLKDVSDWEWSFWSSWSGVLLMWACGHVCISHYVKKAYHTWIHPIYTIIAITSIMGYKLSLVIFCNFVVMHVMTFTGSSICVWITSIGMLSCLNFPQTTDYLNDLCHDQGLDLNGYNMLLIIIAIKNLQCTSAALYAVSKKTKKQNSTYSFMNLLHYVLYFPIFFSGPFITFDQFQHQMQHPMKYSKRYQLKEACRIGFWVLVYEAVCHVCYFSALQLHDDVMDHLPLWAFAGTAFLVGQFFMVKYVVLYGVPSVLMRLDGLEPPAQAQCISTIYFYSEMWKNFDRGLYMFIKTHIYIPLGGSQHGLLRQLFASFCCFSFIYLWHGAQYFVLVWVYLNFAGIAVESIGKAVCGRGRLAGNLSRFLSPAWMYRLQAVVVVPLYMLYVTAIFVFLCNSVDCGMRYAYRLLVEGWPVSTATQYIAFYACVHTSNYLAEGRHKAKQQ